MNGLILDVIVVVVAVLFLIFGLWRGMYKLIFGLISSLAAVVLAVVLASTVTTFVINKTNVDEMLYNALDEKIQNLIPESIDASNVDIVFNTDGTVTISHEANEYESISQYLEGTSLSVIGNFLDSLVMSKTTTSVINPNAGAEDAQPVQTTLAGIMSTTAIVYIIEAIVFILLWIVMYILMRLIMMLVKKLVHATYIGHFIDKVLGLVIGAALAAVLIWGALAVIRLLGTYTWIIPANNLISQSTLTKWLFEHNYLYDFLVKSTNLQGTITELIGKITSISGNGENTGGTDTTAAMLPLYKSVLM